MVLPERDVHGRLVLLAKAGICDVFCLVSLKSSEFEFSILDVTRVKNVNLLAVSSLVDVI